MRLPTVFVIGILTAVCFTVNESEAVIAQSSEMNSVDILRPVARHLSAKERQHLIRYVILPADLSISENRQELLKTLSNLRQVYNEEIIDALIKRLDFQVELGSNDIEPPLTSQFPAIWQLLMINKPALPALTEVVASQSTSNLVRQNGFIVIGKIHNNRLSTQYYLSKQAEAYDDKAKGLRRWAEKLPYGEMPTPDMQKGDAERVIGRRVSSEKTLSPEAFKRQMQERAEYQLDLAAKKDPILRRNRVAKLMVALSSASNPQISEEEREIVLLAMISLRELKAVEATNLILRHIDFPIVSDLSKIRQSLNPSDRFPSISLLRGIGKPALPTIVESMANNSLPRDQTSFCLDIVRDFVDGRTNEPTRYYLFKQAEAYDDKAKNLRRWEERLPYGERPTQKMLAAQPVDVPIVTSQPALTTPDLTTEAGREAAITRLARIFELKDILNAPDVKWTQDDARKKIFAALDELIQLNAIGEGEAGPEMVKMLDFLFAPEPPQPYYPPTEINPAFPPEKPVLPPHPIKPLVFPAVPPGSTKTETYFPAVPKLIAMGPRIAPFIAEEMANHYYGQWTQNAAYTLRRILGSDEAVKKLLLEKAELNEKKANRLRELRDTIPAQ